MPWLVTFRVPLDEYRKEVGREEDDEPQYRTYGAAAELAVRDESVLYRDVYPPVEEAIVPDPYVKVQGWIEAIDESEAVLRGIPFREAMQVLSVLRRADVEADPAVFRDPDGLGYIPDRGDTPVL